MKNPKKTNLFVITGASGAGEDSIIKGLIQKGLPVIRPITTTARPMRRGESQGNPYFFISQNEFEAGINDGKFLEWANVYDSLYGITHTEMNNALGSKKIIIWKVDFKGAKKAKELFPNCVTIFIKPGSIEELKERLLKRGDGEQKFKNRLTYTQQYFEHEDQFDYIVYNRNNELEKAINETEKIIKKHYGETS